MKMVVQILNLLGVAALAVLCSIQWRNDSRLNQDIIHREQVRRQQVDKIGALEQTVKAKSDDLEDFRQRLKISEAAEIDESRQLADAKHRCDQLSGECDQLKTLRDQLKIMLDKWIEAARLRDGAIKKQTEQIAKLIGERDDAIGKFNALADKYNALVREVDAKSPQTRPAGAPAQ